MNNDISNISSSMEKRYTDRYIEMGRSIKTLGWGSTEQQQYRFDQTLIYPDRSQIYDENPDRRMSARDIHIQPSAM